MDKGRLIFSIRMEIAAVRQALRDSDEAALTESQSQINGLLERLTLLLDLLRELEN